MIDLTMNAQEQKDRPVMGGIIFRPEPLISSQEGASVVIVEIPSQDEGAVSIGED